MNKLNNEDLLKLLLNNDTINQVDTKELIELINNKKILDQHPEKIWLAKNEQWYTYLGKGDERKIVKAKTKERLEKRIVDFYCSDFPTFANCFKEWINEKLKYKEIEKGTYDRYINDYKRFLNDFGKHKINKYTEEDITLFCKDTIIKNNLTRKSFINMKILIIGTFKYAYKLHYTDIIIDNVFSNMVLSKKIYAKKIVKKEKEIYMEKEIPKVIEYLWFNPNKFNLGVLLTFLTGLRVGELSALKLTDIDIENKMLYVNKTEVLDKNDNGKYRRYVRDYPKTDNSIRTIYLTDEAIKVLKKLLINNTGEYLFETNGIRSVSTTFWKKIKTMSEKLNIPFTKSMHKIRRTYATNLINKKVDKNIIKDILGHNCIETTEKYYYYSNQDTSTIYNELNNATFIIPEENHDNNVINIRKII